MRNGPSCVGEPRTSAATLQSGGDRFPRMAAIDLQTRPGQPTTVRAGSDPRPKLVAGMEVDSRIGPRTGPGSRTMIKIGRRPRRTARSSRRSGDAALLAPAADGPRERLDPRRSGTKTDGRGAAQASGTERGSRKARATGAQRTGHRTRPARVKPPDTAPSPRDSPGHPEGLSVGPSPRYKLT